MLQQKTSSFDGYATIRRSKGRVEQKLRSSSSSDNSQYEMIEMSSCRTSDSNSMRRKFDSEILYAKRSVAFDESSEVDEGVLNDIESDADAQSGSSDSRRQTFETFKPRNSIESGEDDGSDKDLQQSSECFQSLPYDIIMSPLKSPHYINQLNAMRSKAPCDSSKQFSLYSRPDSPKYGKILYGNRSASPSADSLADNSSSNSSTYSSTVFKHTAMSQSLHLPHPHGDENVILINVNQSPQKANGSNLNYRKSFSSVRWQHESANGNEENALDTSMTMTKSLYNPSISTSQHNSPRRFATLAYPKEKHQQHETSNKSTSSLNEKHFIYLDPILSFKIGSQTTLRTKPPVPWWELAIKSRYRQSCPPMQVNIYFLF
jgi:hypothetical protein